MAHLIARTFVNGVGADWINVVDHVLFDWVLRGAPSAALASLGLTGDVAQVGNLDRVTAPILTRPRRLRPHARFLRSTDLAVSALLGQAAGQPATSNYRRSNPDDVAWSLFLKGAGALLRDYSVAGQYAMATVIWAKELADVTGQGPTFVALFERSYADMVHTAQVWGFHDFLAEIDWEPKQADIQAALDYVGLAAVPAESR